MIVLAARVATTVAARASAPLIRAGTASILGVDRRLTVLSEHDVGSAAVVVALEESISYASTRWDSPLRLMTAVERPGALP